MTEKRKTIDRLIILNRVESVSTADLNIYYIIFNTLLPGAILGSESTESAENEYRVYIYGHKINIRNIHFIHYYIRYI